MEHLKACVEADWAGENKVSSAVAMSAQDRLMEIATLTCRDKRGEQKKDDGGASRERFRTCVEAFEMKSEIFRSREDFWSAIFYMKMASRETAKGCEQEDQVQR